MIGLFGAFCLRAKSVGAIQDELGRPRHQCSLLPLLSIQVQAAAPFLTGASAMGSSTMTFNPLPSAQLCPSRLNVGEGPRADADRSDVAVAHCEGFARDVRRVRVGQTRPAAEFSHTTVLEIRVSQEIQFCCKFRRSSDNGR
jgi:hypothetical protein